jgi:hypothetical protein
MTIVDFARYQKVNGRIKRRTATEAVNDNGGSPQYTYGHQSRLFMSTAGEFLTPIRGPAGVYMKVLSEPKTDSAILPTAW